MMSIAKLIRTSK